VIVVTDPRLQELAREHGKRHKRANGRIAAQRKKVVDPTVLFVVSLITVDHWLVLSEINKPTKDRQKRTHRVSSLSYTAETALAAYIRRCTWSA
jgi:hypothetical protein